MTGHADLSRAVFAAPNVLVMGYPCAVGIAAPLSIVPGAGEAADRGIIMRTDEAFQSLRLVTRIVLDKTGTLTVGRAVVKEVVALGSPENLMALAAAAEASSEHPLGQAILNAALDRGEARGRHPLQRDRHPPSRPWAWSIRYGRWWPWP